MEATLRHAETSLDERIVEYIRNDQISIPPYPVVATQVAAIVSSDDYCLAELERLVGADQVLGAAIMRYANSALGAGRRPVRTLGNAITRIGARNLVRVALASALDREARRNGHLAHLRREVWRHAVMSAELCRQLAERWGLDPGLAFLAGLLHDFGKLVTIMVLEAINETPGGSPLAPIERVDLIERYHIELGMVVAHKWSLPEEIVEVVARHHEPAANNLVGLVGVCDAVLSLIESKPTLTAHDLGEARELRNYRADWAFLAKIAPFLPEVVEALESAEDQSGLAVRPRSETPTSVPAPVTLSGPAFPVCIEVLKANGHEGVCHGVLATRDGLLLRASAGMRPQQLAKLILRGEGTELVLFVKVTHVAQDEGGHWIEVKPYALDTGQTQAWIKLWQDAAMPKTGERT